jgi:hypothetical protein
MGGLAAWAGIGRAWCSEAGAGSAAETGAVEVVRELVSLAAQSGWLRSKLRAISSAAKAPGLRRATRELAARRVGVGCIGLTRRRGEGAS